MCEIKFRGGIDMAKLAVYKAQRTDTKEWVRGRVGQPQSTVDGIEETTYFHFFDGKLWGQCAVRTDTIEQIN